MRRSRRTPSAPWLRRLSNAPSARSTGHSCTSAPGSCAPTASSMLLTQRRGGRAFGLTGAQRRVFQRAANDAECMLPHSKAGGHAKTDGAAHGAALTLTTSSRVCFVAQRQLSTPVCREDVLVKMRSALLACVQARSVCQACMMLACFSEHQLFRPRLEAVSSVVLAHVFLRQVCKLQARESAAACF